MEKTARRNSQKKEEKYQLILEAARKVFTKNGYHNARVETIASEAGIGKGTIYEYFSSKQELFQRMLEKKFDLYHKMFFHSYLENHSLEESVYYVVKHHIERCIENKDLTFLIMQELPSMEGELKEWFYSLNQERERCFREHVKRLIQNHIIRDVDMDALILLMAGVMTSLELNIAMGKWNEDIDHTAHAVTDILLYGMASKAE